MKLIEKNPNKSVLTSSINHEITFNYIVYKCKTCLHTLQRIFPAEDSHSCCTLIIQQSKITAVENLKKLSNNKLAQY